MLKMYVTFCATEASAEIQTGLTKPADMPTSLDSITGREARIEFMVTTWAPYVVSIEYFQAYNFVDHGCFMIHTTPNQ
jgi:hypothetical protein